MGCPFIWGRRSSHMGRLLWNWISVSISTRVPGFWTHQCRFNYHTANIASSKPKVSLEGAFRTAEDLLDGQAVPRIDTNDPKNYLVYLAGEGGSAVLAYRFIVKNKPKSILFEALVDAQSGQLVWIKDMGFHASIGLWVNNWWNSAVWCEGQGSCILYLWIPVVVLTINFFIYVVS